ncbi:Histidine acid phosphatase [Paragonimus heterotremus]|uniref:Multiple inositol polyphosphate phosphatase 1 n=1 Tax=Paragonimus heterotremus TaxID=100268 RepID=A0A8J4WJC5_9TREM|nr:Histidine acid phosphatase [Paragonimus heterotremus]
MGLAYVTNSFVAFVLGLLSVIVLNSDRTDDFPVSGLSTKTAYRHCSLVPFRDAAWDQLHASCQAVHVNALFRHGTRAPSRKNVASFQDLYNRLSSRKHARLPDGFLDYPIPFQDASDKELLPRGFEELYALGKKFANRWSNTFQFTPSNVEFYASSVSRSLQSAHSFYNGLFNLPPLTPNGSRPCAPATQHTPSVGSEVDQKRIEVADHLLRFFDYCKRYNEEIEKNKSSVLEYTKFREGSHMKKVYKTILKKHRLSKKSFTRDDVYTLFLACAHETASQSDSEPLSPWCGFLRPHHLPVIEYMADLKQYWLKSYGYDLNYVQSCPLVGEMLTQILRAAQQFKAHRFNQSHPALHRGTFWFGHAETLLPVVAALGLFNDSVGHTHPVKLLAADFPQWLKKLRFNPPLPTMFRAGHIAPFAGNLALTLYYCPHLASEQKTEDPWAGFVIEPEVNGRTVAWPIASPVQPPTTSCPGATSASLSRVLSYFVGCMPTVYDDQKACALHN